MTRSPCVPDSFTALFVDLHTSIGAQLAVAPRAPIDLHAAIAASAEGTPADKTWASTLLDTVSPAPHHTESGEAATLVLAERGDSLRRRVQAAFGPGWFDLYALTTACVTMTPAEASLVLSYARTHRTPQRNALRALDSAPGLQTRPANNAVAVVIDALENNPGLSPASVTDRSFGVLCDELAATGRALTIAHLLGGRHTGRFKRGHLDALTAAYRRLCQQRTTRRTA